MQGYEIVDVHVHLCRDTAQEKLVFPRKGWPDGWFWGSPDTAEPYMAFHNISYIVAVNFMDYNRMINGRIARLPRDTTAAQIESAKIHLAAELVERVKSFNRWVCEAAKIKKWLVPFVFADPILFGEKVIDEVDECISLGARGLKVHPALGQYLPDHPNMAPVYDRCQAAGIAILSDTGGHERNGVRSTGEPIFWSPVLREFPRLKLIIAHLCSEYWDDRVEMAQEFKGDNLAFDISGGVVDAMHPPASHREMPAEHAPRIFRKIGVDRIFFGSDGPHRDVFDAARQVAALEMTVEEKEKILAKNAKAYLGLA